MRISTSKNLLNIQGSRIPSLHRTPTATSTLHRIRDPRKEPLLQLHHTSRGPDTTYHRKDAERTLTQRCGVPTNLGGPSNMCVHKASCAQAHQTKALREPSVPSNPSHRDHWKWHSCEGQHQPKQHQSVLEVELQATRAANPQPPHRIPPSWLPFAQNGRRREAMLFEILRQS